MVYRAARKRPAISAVRVAEMTVSTVLAAAVVEFLQRGHAADALRSASSAWDTATAKVTVVGAAMLTAFCVYVAWNGVSNLFRHIGEYREGRRYLPGIYKFRRYLLAFATSLAPIAFSVVVLVDLYSG